MTSSFLSSAALACALAPDDWRGLLTAVLMPPQPPVAVQEAVPLPDDLELPAPGAEPRLEPDWNREVQEAAEDADAPSSAPQLPARPDLLPLQMSALVRLAQTQRPVGLRRAVEPGAVTLVDLGAPELLDPALRVLEKRLLPFSGFGTDVKVLRAGSGDGARGAERFAREVEEVLMSDRARTPLLILIASPSDLPRPLAALLPRPLMLAPVCREGLCAHLSFSHPSDEFTPQELPPDDAVRRLTPLPLAMALREPTAAGVIARIAAALAPPPGVTPNLEAVGEMGPAGQIAREIVADLRRYREGHIAWSEMTRSVIFHGLPGTGKTFLIKAMAASAGVPAIIGSFAAWQARGHLGEMLNAMQKTFTEGRAAAPCNLLIDEIDAAGSREDADRHGSNYRRQVINAFLAEVDGVAGLEGVVLAGACNNIRALDPAILRPGRFDRIVEVGLPGPGAQEGILRGHLGGDLARDLATLSRAAVGLTAARIAGAVRAARSAARAQGRALTAEDVLQALAPEGDVPPAVLGRVAIHECGHALIAHLLQTGRVHRMQIGPTGGMTEIDTPLRAMTLPEIGEQLAVLMAGRAAEVLVLGEASAGAGGTPDSDLARATALAQSIDTRFGLGAAGPLYLPDGELFLDAAHARLTAAEARATDLLTPRRRTLEAMAKALVDKGLLEGPALTDWLTTAETEDKRVN